MTREPFPTCRRVIIPRNAIVFCEYAGNYLLRSMTRKRIEATAICESSDFATRSGNRNGRERGYINYLLRHLQKQYVS